MNKREAILFLEKKRDKAIGCLSFFGEGSKESLMNEIRVNTYDIAINTLEQIDEPQAEKVEVLDFVADWYRANKMNLESNIAAAFRRIGSDEHYTKGLIYEWLNDSSNKPIQTLFKMKNGYTVEPKRWVVKQGGSEVWYLQGFRNSLDGDIVKQWCSHEGCIKFTDKSKAEAVAVLVEGSVEEV